MRAQLLRCVEVNRSIQIQRAGIDGAETLHSGINEMYPFSDLIPKNDVKDCLLCTYEYRVIDRDSIGESVAKIVVGGWSYHSCTSVTEPAGI